MTSERSSAGNDAGHDTLNSAPNQSAAGKSGMLDKVKRVFLRMSNPSDFGGRGNQKTLSTSNLPYHLGRTDAVYEFAFDLLHRDLISRASEAERRELYETVKQCFGECLLQLNEAKREAAAGMLPIKTKPFEDYLRLLLIQTDALLPVADGLTWESEDRPVKEDLPGGKLTASLRNTSILLDKTEIHFLHQLQEVMSDHAVAIDDLRAKNRKLLSKTDAERCERTRKAYADELRRGNAI